MDDAASVQSALERAEAALIAVLLQDPNNRGQAKSWLISTISSLQQVPDELRLACFDPSSRRAEHHQPSPLSSCRAAQLQLLQLLMEQQPDEASRLLAADPDFLASYFTASRSNISSWFGHFSMAGIQHFKFGAKALANYALANRSEAWHLLVWAGKHNQAPVAVAAKPHYFCELDVERTIRALGRGSPGFWASDELLRSCQSGEWLKVDPHLAAEELHYLLHSARSARGNQLQELLSSFLQAADWTLLCNRLLPLLADQQIADIVQLLGQQQQQQCRRRRRRRRQQVPDSSLHQWLQKQSDFNDARAVAAPATDIAAAAAATAATQLPCVADQVPLLLSGLQEGCWSPHQALLVNALTNHRAQMLKLLQQEDESGEQLVQLVAAAQQLWPSLCTASTSRNRSSSSSRQQPTSAAAAAAAAGLEPLLRSAAPFMRPQQRLQVLLLAWLLRLHLLLAAAAAAASGGGAAELSMQQLVEGLGCSCSCWNDSSQHIQQQTGNNHPGHELLLPDTTHPEKQQLLQQQPHEHQQQQQLTGQKDQHQQAVNPGDQLEQQQQQQHAQASEHRAPLRRGPAGSAGEAVQPDSAQYRSSAKHKSLKRRRVHSSDSSSSGGDSKAGNDSEEAVRRQHRRKGKKHRHKRRRKLKSKRSRHHSSDSGGSDGAGGGMASEDLDAGGELLDPADFPARRQQSKQAANGPAAAVSLFQGQQHKQQAEVVDLLSRLSVGGQLWEQPQWLLRMPVGPCADGRRVLQVSDSAAVGHGGAGQQQQQQQQQKHILLIGTTAEVVDAIAGYWLWDVLNCLL